MNPDEMAAQVFDAAAAGEIVPGFEAVGSLLIDLGRVEPVAAGTAITSAGVAAATAASTPGSVALLTAAVAKPGSIILGIAGLAVGAIAAVSMTGWEPGATLVDQQLPAAEAPAPDGVQRVVDTVSRTGSLREPFATTTGAPPAPTASASPDTSAGSPAVASSVAPASTTTDGPTTTASDVPSTTTGAPEDPTDEGGEGQIPGSGNGKGNNGQGKGNGGPNGG
jgi:hypothetical protein